MTIDDTPQGIVVSQRTADSLRSYMASDVQDAERYINGSIGRVMGMQVIVDNQVPDFEGWKMTALPDENDR